MALLNDLVGGGLSAVASDKAPALTNVLRRKGRVTGLAQKFPNGGTELGLAVSFPDCRWPAAGPEVDRSARRA